MQTHKNNRDWEAKKKNVRSFWTVEQEDKNNRG